MVKQKDEEIRGIRKINTFMTADALLAAVLLVWAQVWIQPSVQLWAGWYGKKQPEEVFNILQRFDLNVGTGLIWTYSAVLLALLALVWVGYSTLRTPTDRVPATALGLFGASVIMALIDVSQSIYSISRKLLSDRSIWEPLPLPCWWLYLVIAAILGVVGFSIWVARKTSKN